MSRRFALAACLFVACATAPAPLPPPTPAPAAPAPAPWVSDPPPGRLPELAIPAPKSHERTLRNGLRVVLVEHPHGPLVGVRLMLPHAGSAGEPVALAGSTAVSIEMLTATHDHLRAVWMGESEKSLGRQIAEVGGMLSHRTSHDVSWLGIDGFAADLPRFLELLGAGVKEPRAGRFAFSAVRINIHEGLTDRATDDPTLHSELLEQAAFGAAHPYGRPTYGTRAGMRALTYKEITRIQRRILRPQGAVLLIVGGVRPGEAFSLAEENFGEWTAKGDPPAHTPVAPPRPPRASALLLPRTQARITELCATRPLGDVTDSDAALEIFTSILGERRLTQELRELRGLTYSATAQLWRKRQGRALVACAALRARATGEGLQIFLRTLEAMRQTPPTAAEVERARAQLRSRVRAQHAELNAIRERWMRALELGRSQSLEEELAALEAITPEQVHRLAVRLLAPESLQLLFAGSPAQVEPAARAQGVSGLRRYVEPKPPSEEEEDDVMTKSIVEDWVADE
jgi:zinc protease